MQSTSPTVILLANFDNKFLILNFTMAITTDTKTIGFFKTCCVVILISLFFVFFFFERIGKGLVYCLKKIKNIGEEEKKSNKKKMNAKFIFVVTQEN
jgi:hypothetical protein